MAAQDNFEAIIVNSENQLTCGSTCPPTISAADFITSDQTAHHYYDNLDSRAPTSHFVCKESCQHGYYQK
jgi:hypothetical protein